MHRARPLTGGESAPVERHRAGSLPGEPRQAAQQRGLAGAVAAHDAEYAPRRHRKGEPLEHGRLAPEGHGQALRCQALRCQALRGGGLCSWRRTALGGSGRRNRGAGGHLLLHLGHRPSAHAEGGTLGAGKRPVGGGIPVAGHGALFHEHHTVGYSVQPPEPMLRDDHGLSLGLQRCHHLGQAHHGGGVQRGGGLIEHEHRRPHGQSRCQDDRLLLAARELLDAAVEQRAYAERRSRLLHALDDLCARQPQILAAEGDLGGHIQVHELAARVLEYRSHAHAQLVGGPCRHLGAAHEHAPRHLAGIHMGHQAVHQARERRLPATGGPGDHDALAGRHLQAHRAQRRFCRARIGIGHTLKLHSRPGRPRQSLVAPHESTFPATAATASSAATATTTPSSGVTRSSW